MDKPAVKLIGRHLTDLEMISQTRLVIKAAQGGKVSAKFTVAALSAIGREAILKVINEYVEIE